MVAGWGEIEGASHSPPLPQPNCRAYGSWGKFYGSKGGPLLYNGAFQLVRVPNHYLSLPIDSRVHRNLGWVGVGLSSSSS